MRRLATTLAILISLAVPGIAAAHPSAQTLIKRAAGPGTVVWGCHPHNHGVLCNYRSPQPGTYVERADGSRVPVGDWESWAAVEHGRVRLAGIS